jgi:predicted RNase H-like HicB family nuclease
MMANETVHAVVFRDADSNQWVALCLEYDVTTQGDSEEHATALLREAVQLHVEDMSQEEFDLLHQSIDGEPRIHKVSMLKNSRPAIAPRMGDA